MRQLSVIWFVVLLMLTTTPSLFAETVQVAVASNFIKPMEAIVSEFEQSSGYKVNVSYGSSGKHYAQILHGAPFDLFLSADQEKPLQLEQAGLTVKQTRVTYAIGRLVLWSADPKLITESSAHILRRPEIRYLALANPKLAPYGQAAIQVLKRLQLLESSQAQWVIGENISQVYQFINTGNAELGFVAASQVFDGGQLTSGSVWLIPQNFYQPIRQDMVLLNREGSQVAAQELYRFILSPATQRKIRNFGYQ